MNIQYSSLLPMMFLVTILMTLWVYTAASGVGKNPYDFVFGWSTGHVGTTSLSSAETYNNPQNITFIFEANRHPDYVHSLKAKWKTFTHRKELKFVESRFIPLMLELRQNSTTLVDLGHHNLYFIYGLLKYIKLNPDKYRILFVRIRRERHESALSLSYNNQGQKQSVCKMVYRYCPHDRPNDIIMKLNNSTKWNHDFNDYQRALWLVDEVEARWKLFLKNYSPYIHYIEVYWSKFIPNSLNQAALNISLALQLSSFSSNSSSTVKANNITVPHKKMHSYQTLGERQKTEIEKIQKLDVMYQRLMKSEYVDSNHTILN